MDACSKLRMLALCLDNQILIYSISRPVEIRKFCYRYKHPGLSGLKLIPDKGLMAVVGTSPHLIMFSINAQRLQKCRVFNNEDFIGRSCNSLGIIDDMIILGFENTILFLNQKDLTI